MSEPIQQFIYQKLIDTLKTDQPVPTRDIVNALVDLEVKVRVAAYANTQLRDGLKFYRPGPFWTDVVKDTKASQDQGKHAEWILRLTAGPEDPEGA